MAKEWGPSGPGRLLTGSPEWKLRLDGLGLTLAVGGRTLALSVEDESSYRLQRGALWTDFTAHPGTSDSVKVDGLPNEAGDALRHALDLLLADKRAKEAAAYVESSCATISKWLAACRADEWLHRMTRMWMTHERQTALLATRPTLDAAGLRQKLSQPAVRARLSNPAGVEHDLRRWNQDWAGHWAAFNEAHTKSELEACKSLFERVESQPLTDEQARAVVCFDNRVQLVAAAGSGKTSTMVAKAAYAIHRDLVPADKIVLLAFNKQAAEELKERAARAFSRLGMENVAVEASTFHALGLSIIGRATGEKPDIPEWAVDTGSGLRKILEIVDDLKDRSPSFRRAWDLFRFVFGRDLGAFGDEGPADVWDSEGNAGMRTSRGEIVRSQEEVMIANWLFLNGVDYHYERDYELRTADAEHRQYKPDFYYPEIGLYHEHFALDVNGRPPPHFHGYLEGVKWKRALHVERGTELFETTSHGLRDGDDFERLAAVLTSKGVELDPNPDRPVPPLGQKPMDSRELAQLIRTFLSHAKSNGLSGAQLRQRLDDMPNSIFKLRHRLFLDLAIPVIQGWDAALAAEGGIDFEDMLNQAAAHLESGRYDAPYKLVMADEFQDASRARARLCRALVQKPGRYFFAVGDDWQSINRFAGADVSVMTGFQELFGNGRILMLQQTFRCPQALCDISSAFVSKNPGQISKQVRSSAPEIGPVLQAFRVDNKEKLADAVEQFILNLARGVEDGSIPPGKNGRVSVYVLGRYNADRQYVPHPGGRHARTVDVSFLTIHRSKGSEADYVVLPEMLTVSRGRSFPSTRADDPVLGLAMPDGDDYPLGEERRLFYVALTRARRGVAMFTSTGKSSTFLRELQDDGALTITDTDGKAVREQACPVCDRGVIVLRTGPYGEFEACSSYPDCAHKPKKNRSFSRTAPFSRTSRGSRVSSR